MAQRKLQTVLSEFIGSLRESRQLAADAYLWSTPQAGGGRPFITQRRRDSLAELAFLRSFLAWETFLEESFALYLAGQKPPRGRAPIRYAFPPNLKIAMEWVIPEGRGYAKWTSAHDVSVRAERFFRDGRPFAPTLRSQQAALEETRIIRNAIAHESMSARQKFETLVRTKLATLPSGLTVGSFFGMTVPGTTPPISFLESYITKIENLAKQIVRP